MLAYIRLVYQPTDRVSFKRILNGERVSAPSASIQRMDSCGSSAAIMGPSGPTKEDVDDMKRIMETYSNLSGVSSFKQLHDNATNVVASLKERSNDSHELREALTTEKTERGVKIGAWEIIKKSRQTRTGATESYFRVHNPNTGQTIKAPFLISESARTIVKLLNNGADLNHPTVRRIAQLEMDYRAAKDRALEEKSYLLRAREKNREFKINLYEAKYEVSRTRALLIREQIKNIFLST
jgi:hypothetical protein